MRREMLINDGYLWFFSTANVHLIELTDIG